jgi:hypothetical protein
MGRSKIRFSEQSDLELIVIPFFTPSVYRYDLFKTGQNIEFSEITLPEKSFENSSFGARYNVELPGIGFSVSWFRGFDPFHGYDIRKIDWSSGTPEITGSPRPYLKNTIGADFALPLSSWIFRGELACDFNKNSGEKIYIPQSNISYVMGAEHNFGGLNTIIQYAGKYVPGYVPTAIPVLSDPSNPAAQFRYAEEMICYESALFNRKIFNLQKKTNHALMINLTRSILHDAWNLKMTAYYNLTSDDYFIRPEVSWKIADAVSFSAGGTYMNGPARSVFNYSNPLLSGMFLELKVDF